MTPDDNFLQAILASPEDHTPRLVYADWLEEHGRAERAAFIRVQCELARTHEDDPRRKELEVRERVLLAEQEGDWVQLLGLPLTWGQALSLFQWRLAQATAWCRGRDVASLRTPDLEPAPLCGWYTTHQGRREWRYYSTYQRQRSVNELANRRARLVVSRGPLTDEAVGGRLLVFDPDCTCNDEAAVPVSDGFFDEDNVPAWDTWVWYAEHPELGPVRETPFASYLVAWVPAHLVGLADDGIRVNPEMCIQWASDVDTPLTRRLQAAGLLS